MIDLEKGGRIDIEKEDPGIKIAQLDLSWRPQMREGDDFDLDAYVAVLSTSGRPTDTDLIFHRNLQHPSGAVKLSGDDRKGGTGETVIIDFTKLPANVDRIVFAINIDKAEMRRQNFGQVKDSMAVLKNAETGRPIVSCDLGEDFYKETCVIACELYKKNDSWRLKNESAGFSSGLKAFLTEQGFDVK